MEKNLIPLIDFAEQQGQIGAAEKIGCHQTAVSAAIKKGREIYLEIKNDSVVSAFEVKKAFNLPLHQNKKA